ncbi:hypothetical protein G7046_g2102 [Stylonectria norvegica]|nr:hypothetical protein G7046_g2102 [Stylonectria norvegica]
MGSGEAGHDSMAHELLCGDTPTTQAMMDDKRRIFHLEFRCSFPNKMPRLAKLGRDHLHRLPGTAVCGLQPVAQSLRCDEMLDADAMPYHAMLAPSSQRQLFRGLFSFRIDWSRLVSPRLVIGELRPDISPHTLAPAHLSAFLPERHLSTGRQQAAGFLRRLPSPVWRQSQSELSTAGFCPACRFCGCLLCWAALRCALRISSSRAGFSAPVAHLSFTPAEGWELSRK